MKSVCKCNFFKSPGEYICEVTEASIIKLNVDIVKFNGTHQLGKNNRDVTKIKFIKVKVEHFPMNLPKNFPRLKTLVIQNCGLKEISRADLDGLEKLVELDLNENELKSLPDDLFSNMPNLKRVFLAYNKIEFASSKLIEPIAGNQLEVFQMGKNASIDAYYWSIASCKTIHELMTMIDEKCKPPIPQLIAKGAPRELIGDAAAEITDSFNLGLNEHRQQGRFIDFVIKVDSKELPVHKAYLATQSSHFADMFEVKQEVDNFVIFESNIEAVEAFLDYLYKRKQPDAKNAVEIFKLAAQYKVAELKTICETIIRKSLDESNALEIFKLAGGAHNSEELKIAAFRKLQEKCGSDLGENLLNQPEKVQKIVELRCQIEELTREDQE